LAFFSSICLAAELMLQTGQLKVVSEMTAEHIKQMGQKPLQNCEQLKVEQ
jgi:hypothetical protein